MSLLVLGLCALFLSTPQPATVRGRVVDARTLASIADARVVLTELDAAGDLTAGPARTTQTDADGRFEFAGVAAGPHLLAVTTVGYLYVRRHVDVEAAASLDLVVPLPEGAGTYQDNVTVTAEAEREDPGMAPRFLGPAALQDLRGVATDDPMRAVQLAAWRRDGRRLSGGLLGSRLSVPAHWRDD